MVCIISFLGVYLYLEATNAQPGEYCQLLSPVLGYFELRRCLMFEYCDYGSHFSRVRILDDDGTSIPFHNPGFMDGSEPGWQNASVILQPGVKRFIVEGIRGGRTVEEDLGDLAIDNFRLELGACISKRVVS